MAVFFLNVVYSRGVSIPRGQSYRRPICIYYFLGSTGTQRCRLPVDPRGSAATVTGRSHLVFSRFLRSWFPRSQEHSINFGLIANSRCFRSKPCRVIRGGCLITDLSFGVIFAPPGPGSREPHAGRYISIIDLGGSCRGNQTNLSTVVKQTCKNSTRVVRTAVLQ